MPFVRLPALPPVVVGERCVLRGLRRDAADAAALRAIFGDPDVRAWLWEFDGTDEVISRFVDGHLAAWRRGEAADFGVSATEDSPLIALVRIHTFVGSTAKLAWISAPPARGSGVARGGATAAIGWAREVLELRHVFAEIEPRNVASVRLALALGFMPTGRPGSGVRPDGTPAPDEVYALDL